MKSSGWLRRRKRKYILKILKLRDAIQVLRIPVYLAIGLAVVSCYELLNPLLRILIVFGSIFFIGFRKQPKQIPRKGLMDFSRAELYQALIIIAAVVAAPLVGFLTHLTMFWKVSLLWAVYSIAAIALTILAVTIKKEEEARLGISSAKSESSAETHVPKP